MKLDQMLALFGRLSYVVLSSRRVRLFCRTMFFHPVVSVCSVVQRSFIPSCPSVLSYNVLSSRRVRLFCRTTFFHLVVSVCSVVQRSFIPSCPSVLSYNVLSSRRVRLFCRTTFFHPVVSVCSVVQRSITPSIVQVIVAEGEKRAALSLKKAADIMNGSSAALQLRYLQTLNAISSEKNSTIIFPVPINLMNCFTNSPS